MMKLFLYICCVPVLFVVGCAIVVLWFLFSPFAEDMAELACEGMARILVDLER